MNDKMNIRLIVKKYRAVDDATIDVGDITVLSGINACGKSSLAHLFHAFVNTSASFDSLAQVYAFHQADKLMTALSNMMRRIRTSALRMRQGDDRISEDVRRLPYDIWQLVYDSSGSMQGRMKRVSGAISVVMSYMEKNGSRPDVLRYVDGFANEVGMNHRPAMNELKEFFDAELSRIEGLYEKALASRSGKVLSFTAETISKWLKSPGSIELIEGDTSVIKWNAESAERSPVGEVLSLDKAIYIESPWRSIPSRKNDGCLTVQDGLIMLPSRNPFEADKSLFSVLRGSVEEADSEAELALTGESSNWNYNRKDGAQFDLQECATGIKSFSILSILYERGFLDRRTLLIIDEPEAHLHPQWIFEYAKILVRLNKRLGVRLLITTHSPDMLNAIKRVADVEDVGSLNFYLANDVGDGDEYTFSYEPLGRNVEKIFACFNYAMDLTDLYGRDER